MKPTLFFLLLIYANGWLPAQNELFNGGPGSGAIRAASGLLFAPATFPTMYQGGLAAGGTSNTSGLLAPPSAYPELFTGGTADGGTVTTSGLLTPPPTYPNLFTGGAADGAASTASAPFTPPPAYPELYTGGPADGSVAAASAPLFPPLAGQELYTGGVSDGFAFAASAAVAPPAAFSELFAGGVADGFAFLASAPLSPPPTYAELLGGSAADGFAALASGALSPPPTYSQVYGGGLADGADRNAGGFPVANDMALNAILSPNAETPFPVGSQPVSVVLRNSGVDTIVSAELRWKVNNVAQPAYSWSGQMAPGGLDTTVIGHYSFVAGVPHDIAAWSFQPNGLADPLWSNDTAKANGLYAALNGVYTLGGTPADFPAFQSAADALNRGGVLGPVLIRVRDGVYNEQFSLQDIRGTSAQNTVTFQSESADSTAVTLTHALSAQANYLVRLDSADWVTLKGLGFHTPNEAFQAVLVFQHDATHNTLCNSRIVSDARQHPLVSGKGNFNAIRQNYLENGSQGIDFQASVAGPNIPGLNIGGNTFVNQPYSGLALRYADAAEVSGNIFSSATATESYQAISLNNCGNATKIERNRITANAGSGIVLLNSGAPGSRLQVANNMVAITGGTAPTHGIFLNSNFTDLWYNSVLYQGSNALSNAFFAEGGNNNDLRNNVFAHTGSGCVVSANGTDNIQVANYNDYFPGPNATLGRWMGVPVSTLANWQAATGRDANSRSVNPLFFSGTDLHISQAQLNGAGTPIAAIVADIDGESRPAPAPDPGADEISALPDDAGVVQLLAPPSGCGLGANETVRVRIQNFGSTALSAFNVAYRLGNSPPVVQPFAGPAIPPGGTADLDFSTTVNLSVPGDYALRAYTLFAADNHPANDTLAAVLTKGQAIGTPGGLLPADNSVNTPVSPTLSWQPVNFATAYDLRLWAGNGPEPAQPTAANLNQISYVFQPPLAYGTGYNWRVTAKNAWCSAPGSVQHFTTAHLPDLVATGLASTTTVFNGQQIAVQWTTLNQGAGPTTANWGEAVYLSEDALLSNDDVLLGSSGNVGALNPNQTVFNALDVMLPANRFGALFLLVAVDRWNGIPEVNEQNNLVSLPIQINLNPPPDLEVTSVNVPPVGTFPSGQALMVSWSVANTGDGPSVHGSWTDRLYFSTNPVFQPATATVFAEKTHTGNLAVNASYSDNAAWNIPNGLSGTFYIYVTTDIYNAEFEHAFESNNTTRSAAFSVFVPGTADLKVTRVLPPPSGSNKSTVNLQWTVKNEGLAVALPNWTDRIYLSSNANETNLSSAFFLGEKVETAALNPGDSAVLQQAITLPDGITGAYYVHVLTDAGDQVFEYNAANLNNLGHSATALQVLTPDLIVQSLIAPDTAQAGTEMLIYWTLKNQSPAATLLNGSWTDRLAISPSPLPGIGAVAELTTLASTATLLPNGILLRQVTVLAPGGISGQRYIHFDTDYFNTVYEQNGDSNNQLSAGVPVYIKPSSYPDLLPTAITPGPNAVAGAELSFNFSIQNAGTGTGQGTSWEDRVYLQNSPGFNPAQATLLGSFPVIQTLNAGTAYSASGSAVLPSTLTPGTYFLFVQADATNALFENNIEANNILGSAGFTIGAHPPVDLAMASVGTPDSVVAGTPFSLSFSVENRTAVTTPQSAWTDGFFLSVDSLYSPGSDVLLAGNAHTPALAGNGAYSGSLNLTVPAGTATGYYWLLAVADYQFLNPDSNPGNNAGVRRNGAGTALRVFVQFAPPPDLVEFNLSAPAAVTSGQPFSVVFSVANQGVGPTVSGAWSDVFFLSDDFQFNAGDVLLGAVSHVGNLAPGASYTDTLALTIPVQFSGNRVLLALTDYHNAEYEYLHEQNNTAGAAILVNQPPSADLVAENVAGPGTAVAGQSATFNWTTANRGQNLAQGYRRDAVYLSTDTVWQASDPLIGFLDLNFNLPPQNTEPRSLTASLAGVGVDTYYVLVRADILNNIFESDEANNTAVSNQPMVITVPLLPLDTLLPDTLANNTNLYYRIEIPPVLAGETLLATLRTIVPAVNELYLRRNAVPTRVSYDFKFSTPFAGNQDIVVPTLQAGTYYLLAYGSTGNGTEQAITLKAEIIQFQLLSVLANKGGNTGSMTLKVSGAKFTPGMTLQLAAGGDTLTAHAVYFTDATQVFASFNLAGAATGFYDLIARKPNGEQDVLPGAFEVITGSVTGTNGGGNTGGGFYCNLENIGADALTAMSVQYPPTTRPNRLVTMRIDYGNNGNVDIPAPTRFIVSLGGAPLAFNAADLPANAQELLLKFEEAGGPPGVLRPGVTGTITVYTKSIAPLIFRLQ